MFHLFMLPIATFPISVHSMCDIMWLTYECDHREVRGTDYLPPVMTTGIQIYTHYPFFRYTSSHLTPGSVSGINKICSQIARGEVTD